MTIVEQEAIVVYDEHDREIGVAFDECQWLSLMGGDPGDLDQYEIVREVWSGIFNSNPALAASARRCVANYFGEPTP